MMFECKNETENNGKIKTAFEEKRQIGFTFLRFSKMNQFLHNIIITLI